MTNSIPSHVMSGSPARKPSRLVLVVAMAAALAGSAASPQQSRRPLSKKDVTDLLQNFVPSSRVEELVRQYGVTFEMTSDTEDELRKAGATDALIETLRSVAPRTGGEAQRQGGQFRKSPSATLRIKAPAGDFAIWIDPQKWSQSKAEQQGKLTFQNATGDAYAMIIAERLPIPTESLKQIAFSNLQKLDPNAKIISEEQRTVNGRKVVCLQMDASTKSIDFTYYGYYYGGSSGAIQVVTFTLRSVFQSLKPEMTDFLNGLEISETEPLPAPEAETQPEVDRQQISINDGKFVVSYDGLKWKREASKSPGGPGGGKIVLTHFKGDAYAMIIGERLQIPTDALAEVALENFKAAAPDGRITFRQKRVVHGTEVWCLRMVGTIQSISFIYYGYYYSGTQGTIQVITATGSSLIKDYEKDFTEFLNGLQVIE